MTLIAVQAEAAGNQPTHAQVRATRENSSLLFRKSAQLHHRHVTINHYQTTTPASWGREEIW